MVLATLRERPLAAGSLVGPMPAFEASLWPRMRALRQEPVAIGFSQ
jgi:hypothetical protein